VEVAVTPVIGPPVLQAAQLLSTQPVGGAETANVWLTLTDAKEYQAPLRPPTLQICGVQFTKSSTTFGGALLQVFPAPELPELLVLAPLLPELLVLAPLELPELLVEAPLALPDELVLPLLLVDAPLLLVEDAEPELLVVPELVMPLLVLLVPPLLEAPLEELVSPRDTQIWDRQLRGALHVSFA
jgi:hypothetical protein